MEVYQKKENKMFSKVLEKENYSLKSEKIYLFSSYKECNNSYLEDETYFINNINVSNSEKESKTNLIDLSVESEEGKKKNNKKRKRHYKKRTYSHKKKVKKQKSKILNVLNENNSNSIDNIKENDSREKNINDCEKDLKNIIEKKSEIIDEKNNVIELCGKKNNVLEEKKNSEIINNEILEFEKNLLNDNFVLNENLIKKFKQKKNINQKLNKKKENSKEQSYIIHNINNYIRINNPEITYINNNNNIQNFYNNNNEINKINEFSKENYFLSNQQYFINYIRNPLNNYFFINDLVKQNNNYNNILKTHNNYFLDNEVNNQNNEKYNLYDNKNFNIINEQKLNNHYFFKSSSKEEKVINKIIKKNQLKKEKKNMYEENKENSEKKYILMSEFLSRAPIRINPKIGKPYLIKNKEEKKNLLNVKIKIPNEKEEIILSLKEGENINKKIKELIKDEKFIPKIIEQIYKTLNYLNLFNSYHLNIDSKKNLKIINNFINNKKNFNNNNSFCEKKENNSFGLKNY